MSPNLFWTAVLASALSPLVFAQQSGERAIQWGFEQRVRNENWDNILDYNDSTADIRNQIRYRTRAWMTAPVTKDIDVNVGLVQETNQIVNPRAPYRLDEIVFESAYIDFKKLFAKGWALRVGRQNIIEGEGFLFLEGGPFDGSRAIYMNAANLSYTRNKAKLELIAIDDPYRDRFLPRIHDRTKPIIEWNEQAAGAYYTNKNNTRASFEAYYFLKKEFGDYRAPSNPQFQPDRHIHTGGGRTVLAPAKNWSLVSELALQWGAQHPATRIGGWGGYAYAKRQFAGSHKPYLQAGYWAFSGDDPTTKDRVEGFDPLFGRWPKWSELYIYSQYKETGVAYWTNLGMWQAEAGCELTKKLKARGTYYHMSAFQPFPGTTKIYGTGLARGDMYQGRLDFALDKHWSGHALWEQMLPGNFYSAQNPGYFLRFEMIYLLKGHIAL